MHKLVWLILAALALPARAQGLYINLNQNQVVGGSVVGGTVAISQPAPAGGVQVTLWSGDDVRVPHDVVIPAGAKYAGFSVATNPTGQPLYVRILASTDTARQQTFLQVMPNTSSASSSRPQKSGLSMYKEYPMVGPVYGAGPVYYPYGYGYGWGYADPWARPMNIDSDGYPMMRTSEDM